MRRFSDYGTDRLRIAILAPDPAVLRWIRVELDDIVHDECVAVTAAELCTLLDETTEERFDAAVVDFDAMSLNDVALLRRARTNGFEGALVALGRVELETVRHLKISIVLSRPLGSETLRAAMESLAQGGAEHVTAVD